MSDVQVEFMCECGKQTGWIGDGDITQPCPSCGRVYIGKEILNKKTFITEIIAIVYDNK